MGLMVGDRGAVVGIEHIRDLVEVSIRNVRKNHLALLQSGRVTFVVGDGRKGTLQFINKIYANPWTLKRNNAVFLWKLLLKGALFGQSYNIFTMALCMLSLWYYWAFNDQQIFSKFPGYPEAGPYNAIHVGAAAHVIPQDLLSQLKLGGRMVIPLGSETGGQWLEQIDKREDGTIERKKLMGVRYVPLTDREKQWYWNGVTHT